MRRLDKIMPGPRVTFDNSQNIKVPDVVESGKRLERAAVVYERSNRTH